MGLLDLFSKEKSRERNAARAINKYAQSPDRLKAMQTLLAEDAARPSIVWQTAANCWQPYVKGFTPHDNSQYNNLRWEDLWLDK